MQLPTFASGLVALAALAEAAQLTQVTNFGSNPSNARMFIYVPDKLASNPPVVVAIHYCTGTAQAYFSGTPYARLADTHGFLVIYPESPYSGGCWDVSSPSSLTHNGGGNSNAIANMVQWTLSQPQYAADPSRVFAVGTSSGAMMTNVLAATYPALFRAASAYAGVPAGCFATGTEAGWNSTCANGRSIASQEAWAATAKAMGPAGYTGRRPRMRISHGSADDIIFPQNFNETMKQWAGVLGYTYGAPKETVVPKAGWTKYVYGEDLVGVYGTGVTHDIPIDGAADMEWFGITGGAATTTTTSAAATTSTKKPVIDDCEEEMPTPTKKTSTTLATVTTTARTSTAAATTTSLGDDECEADTTTAAVSTTARTSTAAATTTSLGDDECEAETTTAAVSTTLATVTSSRTSSAAVTTTKPVIDDCEEEMPTPTKVSTTLKTVTSSTRTSSAAAVTTTAPACVAARWGQCGGIGFTGCKTCAAPYTCKFSNDWYSQCL